MNEKPTKTPVKVIITPCDPKIAESDRTKERFEIFQKKLLHRTPKPSIELFFKNVDTSEEVFRLLDNFEPDFLHFANVFGSAIESKRIRDKKTASQSFFLTPNDIFQIFGNVSTNRKNHLKGVIIHGSYSADQIGTIAQYADCGIIGISNRLSTESALLFLDHFYLNFSKMENVDAAFVKSAFAVVDSDPHQKNHLPEYQILKNGDIEIYEGFELIQSLKNELEEKGKLIREVEGELQASNIELRELRKDQLKFNDHPNLALWLEYNRNWILLELTTEILPEYYFGKIEEFKIELEAIIELIDGCVVKMQMNLVSDENLKDVFGDWKFRVPVVYHCNLLNKLLEIINSQPFLPQEKEFFDEVISSMTTTLTLIGVKI